MTLPRNCSYTCPRMSAGSAEIDVADPGPDELGVTHDGPDDLRALLKVPGNAGQQGADPEQVERQSRDKQDDVDNSENDQSCHRDRGVQTLAPTPGTKHRLASSGMSFVPDIMFECPVTDWRLLPSGGEDVKI